MAGSSRSTGRMGTPMVRGKATDVLSCAHVGAVRKIVVPVDPVPAADRGTRLPRCATRGKKTRTAGRLLCAWSPLCAKAIPVDGHYLSDPASHLMRVLSVDLRLRGRGRTVEQFVTYERRKIRASFAWRSAPSGCLDPVFACLNRSGCAAFRPRATDGQVNPRLVLLQKSLAGGDPACSAQVWTSWPGRTPAPAGSTRHGVESRPVIGVLPRESAGCGMTTGDGKRLRLKRSGE